MGIVELARVHFIKLLDILKSAECEEFHRSDLCCYQPSFHGVAFGSRSDSSISQVLGHRDFLAGYMIRLFFYSCNKGVDAEQSTDMTAV